MAITQGELDKMQRRCDLFNGLYPIGHSIRYWTGSHEGEGRIGRVKHPAQILGGHTPVVYIDGVGAVALTHVEPIEPEDEAVTA